MTGFEPRISAVVGDCSDKLCHNESAVDYMKRFPQSFAIPFLMYLLLCPIPVSFCLFVLLHLIPIFDSKMCPTNELTVIIFSAILR